MKRVLVTGAAGAIGYNLIKYLLSEGKYEVTALDLKNQKVFKRLHRYRKRVNIVYGDILDRNLVESLIKDTDIVIHLATCLPPFAELKEGISDVIECTGTDNIVKAINYYNPSCHIIYASSTSIYAEDEVTIDSKVKVDKDDYYNYAKYNAEKLVMKKAPNYTIIRVPLVLTDLKNESFIYNVDKKKTIEVITKEDAAYAFCKAIDVIKKLNNKIINIGGGETCRIQYKDLLNKILKVHGMSSSYLSNKIFMPKNFNSPVLLDSDQSNKLLQYQNDSIESYLMRQKRRSKKRKIALLFGSILLKFKRVK